jgi:hypothetical protein
MALRRSSLQPRRRNVLAVQGAYYLVTGVAPFVSRRWFERVTGPKTEWWLVQTAGALVGVAGAGLTCAVIRERVTPEVVGMAVGWALSLTLVDVVHVARRRIAPSYLLDACVEVAILTALAMGENEPTRRSRSSADDAVARP